jgi:hypothetical protein
MSVAKPEPQLASLLGKAGFGGITSSPSPVITSLFVPLMRVPVSAK